MSKRPIIKLPLSTSDKILEVLGWGFLALTWILVIFSYRRLPATIPIHYNGSGRADGFGSKMNIFILPAIATVLYTGMTVLNRFPHIFNYPARIDADNAPAQYTLATRLIRYLKFMIVVIFGVIVWQTIQNVEGHISGLGRWFLPIASGLIFIPALYFVYKLIIGSRQ